jgi:hypothetical protein
MNSGCHMLSLVQCATQLIRKFLNFYRTWGLNIAFVGPHTEQAEWSKNPETLRLQDRSRSRSHITTDSQSASQSWCQAPIWEPRQFYFLLEIFFRQLRFCNFVAPSLTRGRVCYLLVQLLLGHARAVTLASKSPELTAIFYSHLRLPQPGGPGSQEQSGPVIPPGTGYPFCRLLRLAGTPVEVF